MTEPQALCATSSMDSSVEDTNTIAMNVSSSCTSTSLSHDDQNTMTGAASIPTACQSSVDDDASSTRSARSEGRVKQIASTPSTAETTCSGSLEGDLARLRELERKRLVLRHQRFRLEQRLSEFCGKHAEGSSPVADPGRPSRHVIDFPWQDSNSGLRVVYSGPLNEKNQPDGAGGRLQFADGQVYLGDVRNGMRAGHGRNTWPDGQDYVGEWKGNSRNGRGTHVWPDGRKVSGQWQDGHLHGKVYFSWPNGSTYDGMVRKGKKHGRGVHTWHDGRVYSGSFEDGKQNGFGSLTHPDGVKYRGQFCKGVKQGYGIMLWKTRTYDGEWLQNKPHGQGRVVWSNGATYTGQFQDGKYHGLGVYTWPSGKKFVGRWDNGVKNGHGLYTWPNGKKYDGEYKNGLKHGYGRLTWPDGETYSGGFEHNQRSGRGIQCTSTGEVIHCGMWKFDKPEGDCEDIELTNGSSVPTFVTLGPQDSQLMSPIEQDRDICSPKMVARIDDEDDEDCCGQQYYSCYSPLATRPTSIAA